MLRFRVPFALYCLLPLVRATTMQTYDDAKLLASDGAYLDEFGWAVGVYADRALVGAPWHGDGPYPPGAAYVFERQPDGTWVEVAKLLGHGTADSWVGLSVSIWDSRALVGPPNEDILGHVGAGNAYLYEVDSSGTWQQIARFRPSDADDHAGFANDVDLFDSWAVIGASQDDALGTDSGSAYVFEDAGDGNWTQVTELTASDGASWKFFGRSVAVFGERALIGAYVDHVYLFERGNGGSWSEVARLAANDGSGSDAFGMVALSGNRALVGAQYDDDLGTNSGSAYVFEPDEQGAWMQVVKLTASDGAAEDGFGCSVALSGDRAVVGAFQAAGVAARSGAAYVFERDPNGTWHETRKLVASDGAFGDSFAALSISISGDRVLVGAVLDDDQGDRSGSAYVFDIGVGTTFCQSAANSTGAPAILASLGSPSLSANDLLLQVAPVPRVAPGIFFFGPTQVSQPFGNGIRCVGGSILRLPPVAAIDHILTQRVDLSAPPLAGSVIAGSTWNVQAWYRDVPADGAFFNTSSALSIAFED